jgi:molybdopterin-guanine dinucleotide biosynthesis protein A
MDKAFVICSCDTLFIHSGFLRSLVDRVSGEQVMPVNDGNTLQSLWGGIEEVAACGGRALTRRENSLQDSIARLTRSVPLCQPRTLESGVHCLTNINTPFDYEECQEYEERGEVQRSRAHPDRELKDIHMKGS